MPCSGCGWQQIERAREHMASGGNEAEHNAEDRLAPTAYGVWEGMKPYGYTDISKGNEELDHTALGRGMWGGRLPDSCEAVDAELAACFYYLRREIGRGGHDVARSNAHYIMFSGCAGFLSQLSECSSGVYFMFSGCWLRRLFPVD